MKKRGSIFDIVEKLNLLFDASVIVNALSVKNANRSGIFWVSYNILKQLNKYPIFKIVLLLPDNIKFNNSNEFELFLTKFSSIDNTELVNSKISTDIYFSPAFAIPDIILHNSKIKSFNILYDCIPSLKNIPFFTQLEPGHWFYHLINSLNKNIYYPCISKSTKMDFLKLYLNNFDKDKMFLLPISTSQIFIPNYNKITLNAILKKYRVSLNTDDCYIFSFCSIDPRKNLIFTAKCFIKFLCKYKINNLFFLLGGGYYPEFINEFKKGTSNFENFNDKIIYLGYIDDEDVNILYSNSLFFVYLSQYEGFGMPPLEAMQAGTPVICSNNSSLPEVVGDAAITITYNDEEACIKAFEDYYFNKSTRKKYIKKGIKRAKQFSWEKTGKILHDKILKVL